MPRRRREICLVRDAQCSEPSLDDAMLKEAPHAPRGYIYASMMLVAGQVAAVPFVASIPSM